MSTQSNATAWDRQPCGGELIDIKASSEMRVQAKQLLATADCSYSQLQYQEQDIQIRELGAIACVSGIAKITELDNERWIKIEGAWKLQFQTFSPLTDVH